MLYNYQLYTVPKKIKQAGEQSRKRLTTTENKLVVTSWEREGRRGKRGVED